MARLIRITADNVSVQAALNESPMADELWGALPIEGRAQIWGDEIYFGTGMQLPREAGPGDETVEMGAIGYWPPGKALCLFFGPTPMSVGDEIRPASAVQVMGTMEGDPKVLKAVPAGARVRVEAV